MASQKGGVLGFEGGKIGHAPRSQAEASFASSQLSESLLVGGYDTDELAITIRITINSQSK